MECSSQLSGLSSVPQSVQILCHKVLKVQRPCLLLLLGPDSLILRYLDLLGSPGHIRFSHRSRPQKPWAQSQAVGGRGVDTVSFGQLQKVNNKFERYASVCRTEPQKRKTQRKGTRIRNRRSSSSRSPVLPSPPELSARHPDLHSYAPGYRLHFWRLTLHVFFCTGGKDDADHGGSSSSGWTLEVLQTPFLMELL